MGERARRIAGVVAALAVLAAGGTTASAAARAPAARAPVAAAATLGPGSHGPAVRALQTALVRLTYLPPGAASGSYDLRTWHAVVALQGWSGIPRDGIAGPVTRRVVRRARVPVPWSRATGFEVHLTQQVVLLVRGGRVVRAIHVSTGAGGRTPGGHFRIFSRQAMSWSVAFHVWMPLAQYFSGGYAMHEYPDVPAYPASHGCVRVPQPEAGVVWRFGRLGMRVWTSGRTS